MVRRRASMQELIRDRRRHGFIGRAAERAAFRANLELAPEDERHRFLFHVHGTAGVGKTFLIRELEQAARDRGALTALVDERAEDLPEAMAAIGEQFARQGHRFKDLDRMLATHRERRHEAEAAVLETLDRDGNADGDGSGNGDGSGEPSAASLTVARMGVAGAGLIPVVGPFAGALDAERVAAGVDRLRAGLSARLRSREDVLLVLSPERVLTPLLLGELARAAEQTPWIVLFFDTYERTGRLLDGWLHEVMTTFLHGELPANVVVVTAGQRPLDTARWGGHADFVTDLPLEPFTEAEARGLLAARGVTAEPVVAEVLRLTGGLPVLVSTLAEARPADPDDIGDPSATAVERFLRWEDDPVRRAAALACALPRSLDADVFRAAADCPPDAADRLYGWLRGLPFVTAHGDRVRYHDVVRSAMLRSERLRSPRGWAQRHTRLAEAFGAWRAEAEAGLGPGERWADEAWLRLRLAESYHLLCGAPRTALSTVLQDVIDACGAGEPVARRWAQALADAGRDADAAGLAVWGKELLRALAADGTLAALGVLLARAGFTARLRAVVCWRRGTVLSGREEHARAVDEFDRALAFDPGLGRAYRARAVARARLGDRTGAVADLDRAVELEPDRVETLLLRGDQRRVLGAYGEALADLDRAVELDPASAPARAARGVTRHLLGRLEEATADLDLALELDPEFVWAWVRRARVWRSRHREERRVADLDRAVALGPDSAWVRCERGDALTAAGRYEDALADYDRAVALDGGYASAYASRGACRFRAGRPDGALADLDRALELEPAYGWALYRRAEVRLHTGAHDGALTDLDRLLDLDGGYAPAHTLRGRALLGLGRPAEALAAVGRRLGPPPSVPPAGPDLDEAADLIEALRAVPGADLPELGRLADRVARAREAAGA
ncbi:tetratricopeptide repeat protein [Streptomyces sp. NPDC059786]|uniref:tetratricopeptide repeat protein n=1 Tax=Streptomyces sp. NPDC059786 TaxID=3346946 RepID=UPI00365EB918